MNRQINLPKMQGAFIFCKWKRKTVDQSTSTYEEHRFFIRFRDLLKDGLRSTLAIGMPAIIKLGIRDCLSRLCCIYPPLPVLRHLGLRREKTKNSQKT